MIRVDDLHFTYPGAKNETLRGFSFEVEDGETFGFLGPSGAGKSTTQKVLIGILQGFTGSISIMGKPLTEHGRDYYQRVGVGFELPNVYSRLSALENLEFFASMYAGGTADPKALLASVGLSDAADQRVSGYSKGMKMRLNFCRALLNQPQLVFFDEPTGGLDPANARNLRDIIRGLKDDGKTVFMTTHNMVEAAELCDRVAFMVDGTLPFIDSPREMMLRHGKRQVRVEVDSDNGPESHEFPIEGLSENDAFQSLLRERTIRSIHTLEATLEDVFLEVTGLKLTEL